MATLRNPGRQVTWLPALLALCLAAGCTGFEPYEPRNDRVEGPDRGLVSGEAGEFVIYREDEEDGKKKW
jgi:hypothetical protein